MAGPVTAARGLGTGAARRRRRSVRDVIQRALTFGAVAPTYERHRPGYPAELVDTVLTYAARPVRTALEIGAGTGKATRVFAARGIAVTATDPDAAMLEELCRHVPPTVTTVRAALEDLAPDVTHDLVFAAAALHWTEPVGRWERVAALLVPGGTFASFGGQVDLADPDLAAVVDAVRRPFLESDDVPSPDGTPAQEDLLWPGTELARTPLFTGVRQLTIPRRSTISARDHVGHLATVSAYLVLPRPVREELLGRIMRVLPEQVDVVADLDVHLARRV